MADEVTPGEEALRRAMVESGLDPNDPEQRAAFAKMATGALIQLGAELNRIVMEVGAAFNEAFKKITSGLDDKGNDDGQR